MWRYYTRTRYAIELSLTLGIGFVLGVVSALAFVGFVMATS